MIIFHPLEWHWPLTNPFPPGEDSAAQQTASLVRLGPTQHAFACPSESIAVKLDKHVLRKQDARQGNAKPDGDS